MSIRNTVVTGFLALALLAAPCAAAGADFDGSRPLLMAVIDVLECHPGGVCDKISPQEAGLPRFFEIDFAKKDISEVGDAQDERRTAIQTVTRENGVVILQGAQNGRGWSLTITEETGEAVAAIADPVSGFILFGACTPR